MPLYVGTMFAGEQKKGQPKRLTQRASAFILGITTQHLNAVLKGKRASQSLVHRYADMKNRFATDAATAEERRKARAYETMARAAKCLMVTTEVLHATLRRKRRDPELLKRYRNLSQFTAHHKEQLDEDPFEMLQAIIELQDYLYPDEATSEGTQQSTFEPKQNHHEQNRSTSETEVQGGV